MAGNKKHRSRCTNSPMIEALGAGEWWRGRARQVVRRLLRAAPARPRCASVRAPRRADRLAPQRHRLVAVKGAPAGGVTVIRTVSASLPAALQRPLRGRVELDRERRAGPALTDRVARPDALALGQDLDAQARAGASDGERALDGLTALGAGETAAEPASAAGRLGVGRGQRGSPARSRRRLRCGGRGRAAVGVAVAVAVAVGRRGGGRASPWRWRSDARWASASASRRPARRGPRRACPGGASQTNSYVPSALKVQVPLQPVAGRRRRAAAGPDRNRRRSACRTSAAPA